MEKRIEQARTGFLKKDMESVQQAHTPAAIHKSIGHHEPHPSGFNLPEIILGGQDGLVNVLGVILGIAAATYDTHIVIVAGLSAAFAESISMAAVAYTSKIAEADYYQSEYEREKWEIDHVADGERQEIRTIYMQYGFKGKVLDDIVNTITADKSLWLKVMMEQELKLAFVQRSDALPAGIVVGISALIGSFIPLLPFFFLPIQWAIWISLIIASSTLFAVGFYKAKQTIGRKFFRSALEMMIIGMVSAGIGYIIGSFLKV